MKILLKSSLLIAFIATMGCGKDHDSPDTAGAPNQVPNAPILSDMDTFRSIFTVINSQISGNNTHGTATFEKKDDGYSMRVKLLNTPTGAKHTLSISSGSDCPIKADRNSDGHIDSVEGEAIYGTAIMDIDVNRSSIDQQFKINVTDLWNRTLVIKGVREGILPATVQGSASSYPIACSKIHLIPYEG